MNETAPKLWGPVLIGMRGGGKTTVGRLVAERSGMVFFDTDAEIERRTGRTVAQWFAEAGEAGFRAAELPVLLEVLERTATVLATGGGAILHETVRERLAEQAHAGRRIVWLRASVEVHAARIRASDRPSLTGKPIDEELAELLANRTAHYEACATQIIDTDTLTAQEVADRIPV